MKGCGTKLNRTLCLNNSSANNRWPCPDQYPLNSEPRDSPQYPPAAQHLLSLAENAPAEAPHDAGSGVACGLTGQDGHFLQLWCCLVLQVCDLRLHCIHTHSNSLQKCWETAAKKILIMHVLGLLKHWSKCNELENAILPFQQIYSNTHFFNIWIVSFIQS